MCEKETNCPNQKVPACHVRVVSARVRRSPSPTALQFQRPARARVVFMAAEAESAAGAAGASQLPYRRRCRHRRCLFTGRYVSVSVYASRGRVVCGGRRRLFSGLSGGVSCRHHGGRGGQITPPPPAAAAGSTPEPGPLSAPPLTRDESGAATC